MEKNRAKRDLGSRIVWVYVLPTLLAMILCFIAFTSYMRSFLYETAYTETSKNFLQVSHRFEQKLLEYSEPFMRLPGALKYRGTSGMREVLAGEQHRRKSVDVYYGATDGTFISAKSLRRDPSHPEFRTKDWYLEPNHNNGLAYSGPSVNYGAGKRVVTLSLPVRKKGKRVQGVVAEDIDVNEFRPALAPLSKESGGITMVVFNETDSVFTYFPYQTNLGGISLDSVYALKRMFSGIYQVDSLETATVSNFHFKHRDGSEYSVMVLPLNKLPIHLVHIVPQDKTAALLRQKSSNFVVFAGGCVLVLILVSLVTSKILFRRIVSKDLMDSVNSSTLFDAILGSEYFSIILTDSQFNVLQASANIASVTGDGDWHRLQGKNLWDLIPNPEFKDFVLNAQKSAAPQTSEIGQHQIVVQRQDGKILWWNISFNLLIEDDASVRYLFMVSDETSAVRKDSILDSIMESSQNTIIIFDSDWKISYVSKRFGDICDLDPTKLVGMAYEDLIQFGIPEKVLELPMAALESGSVWSGNFELPLHNGTKIWCRGQGSVLVSKDSSAIGYLFFITDITPIVEAEREAKAATKAKSEFLANMSHEIRTPMNAIIGMSDLALSTELTPRQEHYVDRISYAAKSLLEIINNVLDFSKLEAKKQELEHIPFAIRETISDVLSIAVVRIAGKPVELLADIDAKIPERIFGDPLRLSQVLTNLINNAEKFTEKGQVLLKMDLQKLENGKAEIRICVRDSGIGMTKEQSGRLFRMFSQGDGSTTRKYGGTGLGLAISHSLVELMGGELQVSSELGKGSEFYFTVTFDAVERPATKGISQLKGKRILAADGNPVSLDILRKMFEATGILGEYTSSPEEALSLFENCSDKPFDGIVLSWNLGQKSAGDVVREMRATKKSLPPLVAISMQNDESRLKEAIEAGFKRFLPKPFLLSDLQTTLEEALGFRVLENSNRKHVAKQQEFHFERAAVLLVEDNALNQELAIELLNRVGLDVDVAGNGKEGLEAVQQNHYALVLMDLQMPIMDGFEATRRIRNLPDAEKNSIPIIAMSARALRGDREKSLSAGLNAHVTKPIDPVEFYSELSKWLEPIHPAEKEDASDVVASPLKDPFLAAFERIPDFDAELGLYRSAGSKTIYLKVIRQFAVDFDGYVSKLRETLRNGDAETAMRMAHTLKGIAGTIGCVKLQELAASLEYRISSDARHAEDSTSWSKMGEILQNLISRLRDAIPLVAETFGEQEENQVEDPDALEKLAKMIAAIEPAIQNAVPADCRACLKRVAHIRFDETVSNWIFQLKQAVDDFDFEMAEKALEELKKTIRV